MAPLVRAPLTRNFATAKFACCGGWTWLRDRSRAELVQSYDKQRASAVGVADLPIKPQLSARSRTSMTGRGAVRWGRCPADSMISSLA